MKTLISVGRFYLQVLVQMINQNTRVALAPLVAENLPAQ